MKLSKTVFFSMLFFIIPIVGIFPFEEKERQVFEETGQTLNLQETMDEHAKSLTDKTFGEEQTQIVSSDIPQEYDGLSEPSAAEESVSEVALSDILVMIESTGETKTIAPLDFIAGAIGAEMPPTFHPEALKAQGVAAYTYALRRNMQLEEGAVPIEPEKWRGMVTKDVFFQRYDQDSEAYWNIIQQAATEVMGQVLVHEGKPIVAAYHSTSAGKTENAQNVWNGSVPYLVPVDSSADKEAPGYRSTVTMTSKELKNKLSEKIPDLKLPEDKIGWIEILSRTDSDYVETVQIGDPSAEQTLSGLEMRTLLGLRSSCFDVTYQKEEGFTFTVFGYGHGVGLSQYGANAMGEQGADYKEILAHYYPTTELTSAAEKE